MLAWQAKQTDRFDSLFKVFKQRLELAKASSRGRDRTTPEVVQRSVARSMAERSETGKLTLGKLVKSSAVQLSKNIRLLLVGLVVAPPNERRELSRQALWRCHRIVKTKTKEKEKATEDYLDYMLYVATETCLSENGTVFDDPFAEAVCVGLLSQELGCTSARVFEVVLEEVCVQQSEQRAQ